MTIQILTIDSEYESACRLGYQTHTHFDDFSNKFDNDIVVRWGNSYYISSSKNNTKQSDFKNVINPADKIKLNCKKHEAIKFLAQVVDVPTIYTKSVPKNVSAVIRPNEHSAGNGFFVKKGPLKIEKGFYGTRYLKTDAEYRVWFCGDKTMCGRRIRMSYNEKTKFPCRSNWGYEFSTSIASKLHHQTLMAAKKIGLEVGAADVLFYKGKYYFLELNSAASIDHRKIREFYQKSIKELFRKKFPQLFEEKSSAPTVNNDDSLKKKRLSRNRRRSRIQLSARKNCVNRTNYSPRCSARKNRVRNRTR